MDDNPKIEIAGIHKLGPKIPITRTQVLDGRVCLIEDGNELSPTEAAERLWPDHPAR